MVLILFKWQVVSNTTAPQTSAKTNCVYGQIGAVAVFPRERKNVSQDKKGI